MLTAIIILALLSLLVATERDPANAPVEPAADKPVLPSSQRNEPEAAARPGRVAA